MNLRESLHLSRFAHLINLDCGVVYYNSIYMRPVLISYESQSYLNKFLSTKESNYDELDKVENILNELIDNKIIIDSTNSDELALIRIRDSIPTPYISVIYLILTENCNFDCKYCFINDSLNKRELPPVDMSYEVADAGINLFCRLTEKDQTSLNQGERTIILYGGEPLLNKDCLKHILNRLKTDKELGKIKFKSNIVLNTNGSLLDDETLTLLKENEVSVSISIDGDFKCNINRIDKQEENTFKKVDVSIKKAVYQGLKISLSVTVTESTLNNFDKCMEYIIESGVKYIGFNILMPSKRMSLKEDYPERAANFLIDAYNVLSKHGIADDRIMRKIKAFSNRELYLHDCAATGGGQIVVAPDGRIGICQGLIGDKTFKITDVFDLEFDPEDNLTYIDWLKRTPILMKVCEECIALGICGGGCPKNVYNRDGTIHGIDETFCTHSKKTIEWMIKKLIKESIDKTN